MYTKLEIPVNGQKLHISVKIGVYTNLVFTVLNYHSTLDQVHPKNNLFKTSRCIYQVDGLSQTIICKLNVLKGSLAVPLLTWSTD